MHINIYSMYTQEATHPHTFGAASGLVYQPQGAGSDNIDSNENASSSACRLIYSSFSSHIHIPASHSNTFLCDVSRKTRTVQSIVICCLASPSDVTNILVGGRKQQFPPNWKAPRPFRHWCYLAAVSPSWPSMKDEPLYISSLSLWIGPKLHHHSNGCLACTPRDIVIPQIAWKKAIACVCVWQWILRLWKCVCVCV